MPSRRTSGGTVAAGRGGGRRTPQAGRARDRPRRRPDAAASRRTPGTPPSIRRARTPNSSTPCSSRSSGSRSACSSWSSAWSLFCVIRFRARSDDEAPKQIHGNTTLRADLDDRSRPCCSPGSPSRPSRWCSRPTPIPKAAMTIDVTGHRWWWQFGYDGPRQSARCCQHGQRACTSPSGQKVVLQLTSVDVIHNFWVPELAGKIYAIPGRTNQMAASKPTTPAPTSASAPSTAARRTPTCASGSSARPSRTSRHGSASQQQPPSQPPPTAAAAAGLALFNSAGLFRLPHHHGYLGRRGGTRTSPTSRAGRSSPAASSRTTTTICEPGCRNPPAQKPGSVMPNLNLTEDEITELIAYLDTLH